MSMTQTKFNCDGNRSTISFTLPFHRSFKMENSVIVRNLIIEGRDNFTASKIRVSIPLPEELVLVARRKEKIKMTFPVDCVFDRDRVTYILEVDAYVELETNDKSFSIRLHYGDTTILKVIQDSDSGRDYHVTNEISFDLIGCDVVAKLQHDGMKMDFTQLRYINGKLHQPFTEVMFDEELKVTVPLLIELPTKSRYLNTDVIRGMFYKYEKSVKHLQDYKLSRHHVPYFEGNVKLNDAFAKFISVVLQIDDKHYHLEEETDMMLRSLEVSINAL